MVLRVLLCSLSLLLCGGVRAETGSHAAPEPVPIEAGILGGALLGGGVGFVAGVSTVVVWTNGTPSQEFLDGRVGTTLIAGSLLAGMFAGGVVGGAAMGDPLSGLGGGAGAAAAAMLPTAVTASMVADVGVPDAPMILVAGLLTLLLPGTLAGVGTAAAIGVAVGTCASGDCTTIKQGISGMSNSGGDALVLGAAGAYLGGTSGMLLSSIWLVNNARERRMLLPAPESPAADWATLALPVAGAALGGTVGGALAGDIGAGVVAGTGGALGAMVGAVGYAATASVFDDTEVLRTWGPALALILPTLTMTPGVGAALLLCATGTQCWTDDSDDSDDGQASWGGAGASDSAMASMNASSLGAGPSP